MSSETSIGIVDVLNVGPRLVGRTRSQLALVRSLLGYVPCIGSLVGTSSGEPAAQAPVTKEQVDVLSVIATEADTTADGADADAGVQAEKDTSGSATKERSAEIIEHPTVTAAAAVASTAPVESELAIQDYDGLAASQVVPRLATMTPDELRAVEAYETANRGRRTILNRVAQLLKD